MKRFGTEHKKQLHADQMDRVRHPGLASVIERNISTIAKLRHETQAKRTLEHRLADLLTRFSGSMLFAYLHAAWFALWIAVNLGWLGLTPFDPYPFGLLTLIVSLEAIFLSTFVLISQNRQAELADQRADMDLQINLLTEYEVTRLLILVDRLAKHFKVLKANDGELEELEQDVDPEVLQAELNSLGKAMGESDRH